jgi:hypothetical protein
MRCSVRPYREQARSHIGMQTPVGASLLAIGASMGTAKLAHIPCISRIRA